MASFAFFSEIRFNPLPQPGRLLVRPPGIPLPVAKHQDVMASRRDLESPLGHSTLIPKRDVLLDAYNVKRYT
jgi:hypothetical protein